ncbi:hypothetical protein D3C80_1682510 [compost metagenome]
MACFVECDSTFLVFRNDLVFLFQTTDDSVNGIQEILLFDKLFVFTCSNQGRFIT